MFDIPYGTWNAFAVDGVQCYGDGGHGLTVTAVTDSLAVYAYSHVSPPGYCRDEPVEWCNRTQFLHQHIHP